jgi:hypothetical protein
MTRPAPQIQTPAGAGARLLSGRVLNRICEALKARTQLNAPGAAPKGKTPGATSGPGSLPLVVEGAKFAPNRVYVVGPKFWARLLAQMNGRKDATQPPGVTPAGLASHSTALGQIEDVLRKLAPPANTLSAGPDGYRLPVVASRMASMRLEVEEKLAYASICSQGAASTPDSFLIKLTTTDEWTNGSIISTIEASGVIQTWEPGGGPDECAALVYDTNFDPEFDYGELVESTSEEEVTSHATVFAAAISAANEATPVVTTHSWEWLEAAWRATSDPGAFSHAVGSLVTVGVFTFGGADVRAVTHRWRLVNTGAATLRASWELRNATDAVEEDGALTLGVGQTSDWVEPPAISSAVSLHYQITRLRVGPW